MHKHDRISLLGPPPSRSRDAGIHLPTVPTALVSTRRVPSVVHIHGTRPPASVPAPSLLPIPLLRALLTVPLVRACTRALYGNDRACRDPYVNAGCRSPVISRESHTSISCCCTTGSGIGSMTPSDLTVAVPPHQRRAPAACDSDSLKYTRHAACGLWACDAQARQ